MLHGHGDDRYRYGKEIIADFSTNVWYGGEPAGLKEHLLDQWERVNRYPEVIAESLRSQIGAHFGFSDTQVLVNNGTTESIYLIAQLFRGKRSTIVVPAFSEYEDACQIFEHEIQYLPWNEALELPRLKADLVFLCSPNNPTGLLFEDLQYWLKLNPQCLFVVDEAFVDFTVEQKSVIPLTRKFPNLIVMRSMTKLYAIPGLRLGYLLGNEEIVGQLAGIKQPWTVNAMALAAGGFIFDRIGEIPSPVPLLTEHKGTFVQELSKIEAIECFESLTHFFLCRTLVRNAAQLKEYLVEKHGLLIRDACNFRTLTRQHFRIATLDPASNQLLVNALWEWQTLYY